MTKIISEHMKNTINKGDVIAVGDIHATWGPFRQFLEWVDGSEATVVILGDMIDRGGDDIPVLESCYLRCQDPERFGLQSFYALKGNHEAMFIDAVREYNNMWSESYNIWRKNGGNDEAYEEMLQFLDWMKQLPVYMVIGENMFIHAGIYPGHDPRDSVIAGQANNLLWIRGVFLEHGPDFQKWNPNLKRVFHGHTPQKSFKPDIHPDRVNLDTAAFFSRGGKLTAYNVTQNYYVQFSEK